MNDFDKALNISPNDPYVLAQRGRLLLTYMDAHELAIDNLTKAISFSSRIEEGSREKVLSNFHRELADAYFIYGRTLYEQGQSADMLQNALNEYSSVIELDSANSLSHGQRGFISGRTSVMIQTTKTLLKRVWKMSPKPLIIWSKI